MKVIRPGEFRADRPWGALQIARMAQVTVQLHWTNEPYRWHANDGEEVFTVLDGIVDMHYRENDAQNVVTLTAGDIFFAGAGTEHSAHPRGEARVLVIETSGSA